MVEKDNTKLVNESEEVKLSTKMGKKISRHCQKLEGF